MNISQTAKATEFKFITQINCEKWKISCTKVVQQGHNLGRIDLFYNFGIFSICLEWLQLWTSNSVSTFFISASAELDHGGKNYVTWLHLYLRFAANNSETDKAIGVLFSA